MKNRFHRFDVLAAWYGEYLRIKGYRPRTIKDYRFELSFFRRFIEKDTSIDDIDEFSPELIRQFITSLYDRQLSPATIHHKCAALINFFGAVYKENKLYIDLRSGITLPRRGKKLPAHMLNEVEMGKVFSWLETAACRLTRIHTLDDALVLRDHAVMELLYASGMRLSELVHLDCGDIDYDNGLVRIREGKGGKDRVVPIGRSAVDALRKYLDLARSFLTRGGDALLYTRFGFRMGPQAVRDTVQRVIEHAGIRKKVTVHGIRHSCATHMLNNGADIRYVQELLGHSCLTSTQVYTHVSIDKLKKTHTRYHPRNKGVV